MFGWTISLSFQKEVHQENRPVYMSECPERWCHVLYSVYLMSYLCCRRPLRGPRMWVHSSMFVCVCVSAESLSHQCVILTVCSGLMCVCVLKPPRQHTWHTNTHSGQVMLWPFHAFAHNSLARTHSSSEEGCESALALTNVPGRSPATRAENELKMKMSCWRLVKRPHLWAPNRPSPKKHANASALYSDFIRCIFGEAFCSFIA